MMIWFAAILKILVVITPMKIKQKKNTLSCECGAFYTITHVDYRVISYKY